MSSALTTPKADASGRRAAPRPVRVGRASLLVRRRVVAVGVVTALIAAVTAAWTMVLGDFPVPPSQVIATTFGMGSGEYDLIVRTLRLPRTLAAAGVGVAFGISGALFQGLVRNPLVSPDIIGVAAGATVAAVALIVTGGPAGLLPLAAFAGAVLAAAILYALSWRGGVAGGRMVLIGIGVHAVLMAVTTFLLVRYPVERISAAVLWQTGTLYGRGWQHVVWLVVGLGVLVPAALALMPRLRVLQLGDASAASLGARTELSRAALIVVASGLAAVAVAVAGPVGFVALMVPHVGRMLLGPLTGGVLVVVGLLGAVLVLASDLLAQHLFSPITLPVGVVTAAVGAPYFLFLLYRTNRGT